MKTPERPSSSPRTLPKAAESADGHDGMRLRSASTEVSSSGMMSIACVGVNRKTEGAMSSRIGAAANSKGQLHHSSGVRGVAKVGSGCGPLAGNQMAGRHNNACPLHWRGTACQPQRRQRLYGRHDTVTHHVDVRPSAQKQPRGLDPALFTRCTQWCGSRVRVGEAMVGAVV